MQTPADHDAWPFEEILRSIADPARERAEATCAARWIHPAAWDGFERGLLEALARLTVRPLLHERDRLRASPARRWPADRGLGPLVHRWPVLETLVTSATGAWIEATTELVERFVSDRAALEETFGGSGPLVGGETGLSDPHAGGRTVARLTFASGARVVYKPRDLRPERAVFEFLERLDGELGLEPATPVILPRERYGWMEDVAVAPCADRAGARAFHYRAGRLLLALHALGATDVHAGNVIAAGARPVPVDLETVVQPRRAAVPADDLLATGVLPFWKRGLDGRMYDVGALTGTAARAGIPRIWRLPDGERGEIELGYRATPGTVHRAVLDGAPLDAARFADDVAAGFSDAWRTLARLRDRPAGLDDWLDPFRTLRVRVLLRPTLAYVGAAFASLDPDLLADPRRRRAAIEAFLAERGVAAGLPVLGREVDAVERLDVPVFHARADRREVEGDGAAAIRLDRSGFRSVLDRVAGLDERRLRRALDLVRSSLRLATLSRALGAARTGDRTFPPP